MTLIMASKVNNAMTAIMIWAGKRAFTLITTSLVFHYWVNMPLPPAKNAIWIALSKTPLSNVLVATEKMTHINKH